MPVAATLPADNNDIVHVMFDDQLILVYSRSWTAQTSQKGHWTAGLETCLDVVKGPQQKQPSACHSSHLHTHLCSTQ